MAPDMRKGPDWFRVVMGHYPTGVTVVTAAGPDGMPIGLTANSVTSVSLDPPLLLVCLSKESSSLEPILERQAFAVNILDADGASIASQFASPDRESRFNGVDFSVVGGSPILEGVLAWVLCELYKTFEAGDHLILVGRVLDGGASDGDPLLFFQGRYGRLRQ